MIGVKQVAKEICNQIADLLQQEYKLHEGQWWLWSLGSPARPLTKDEVEDARADGLLPTDSTRTC